MPNKYKKTKGGHNEGPNPGGGFPKLKGEPGDRKKGENKGNLKALKMMKKGTHHTTE